MKTREELNALKAKVETVSKKLQELTAEELGQVAGGDQSYRGETDIEASTDKRTVFTWEISENP